MPRFQANTQIQTMDRLLQRQEEAARMIALGYTNKDIAETLGYSYNYVSILKRNPGVQKKARELADARDTSASDMKERIERGAQSALGFLLRVLDPDSAEYAVTKPSTKIRAAQDLLDREGSVPRTTRSTVSGRTINLHLTGDDIAQLNERARKTAPKRVIPIKQIEQKGSKDEDIIPADLLAQEEVG